MMGHAINHLSFDVNTSRGDILAECNDVARRETDWGTDSPIDNIRFIDRTFETREEAEDYIESIDTHWYDQIAVKYKDRVVHPDTPAIRVLLARAEELTREYNALNDVPYAKTVSSDFFACHSCKSKLNRIQMLCHGNSCPVCRAELRSATTMKKLTSLRDRIMTANKKVMDARKKNSSGGKIKYLVKIEYHV